MELDSICIELIVVACQMEQKKFGCKEIWKLY